MGLDIGKFVYLWLMPESIFPLLVVLASAFKVFINCTPLEGNTFAGDAEEVGLIFVVFLKFAKDIVDIGLDDIVIGSQLDEVL